MLEHNNENQSSQPTAAATLAVDRALNNGRMDGRYGSSRTGAVHFTRDISL